jgi:hypothetical protein
MSLPLFEEDGNEGPHSVDDTPEVDAEDPGPVGLGDGPEGTTDGDPGVVVDEVHSTEPLERLVPEIFDRRTDRDVGDD